MLLLIDENVPDSVARVFVAAAHEMYLARDLFAPKTADPVLAQAADWSGAIIVSWDQDVRRIATRLPTGQQRHTFQRLGRITFICRESRGRARAEELLDWIEFEYSRVQKREDARLFIEIGENSHRSFS